MAAFVLKETNIIRKKKFDFAGFFCSSVGLFCLLLALSKGVDDGWDAPYIIALFYVAFAMLTMFILIELTVTDPLLDLSLFRDKSFALGNLVISTAQFLLMSSMYLIPLFLQNMMGYSATESGIILLPSAAASFVMSPLSGVLSAKFGEKPVVILGLVLSIWWTSQLADTDAMLIMIMQALRGASVSLVVMTATVLSMQNISGAKIGQANAMINTTRQVTGSFAITAMAFLARTANTQSVYFSYDDAFFVLEIFAIIGLIAALLIKSRKKHKEIVS